MPDFASFARTLGLSFSNPDLLVEALTHRSYLNEHPEYTGGHNERLEFLGDAVLDLVITEFLFKKFPSKPEGELTSYHAALVNAVSLAECAQALNVGDFLLLAKGEAKAGRARETRLANAFEAVIGAVYLDSGYASAEAFIAKNLYVKIDTIIATGSHQDAKSRFQEITQKHKGITPTYKILSEEGPAHEPSFTVGLFIGAEEVARGEGASKQEAERAAAEAGLDKMGW